MALPNFLALRRQLGLTQSRAAALFGVDIRTWQNWEADKPAPGPAQVLAIVFKQHPEIATELLQEPATST